MPQLIRELEQIRPALRRQRLSGRLDIREIHDAGAEFPCFLIGAEMDVTGGAAAAVFKLAELQGEPQLFLIGQLLVVKYQNRVLAHAGVNGRDLIRRQRVPAVDPGYFTRENRRELCDRYGHAVSPRANPNAAKPYRDRLSGFLFGTDDSGSHRAARRLHRRLRGRRGAGYRDVDRPFDLAIGQQPDAVEVVVAEARLDQHLLGDHLAGVDLARLDRRVERADIQRCITLAKQVVEPALRQPAIDRQLPALEPVQRHALARLLALHTLARRLALARANIAAKPFEFQPGARIVANFVQFHVRSSTLIRWATLRIMPRTEGVSSSSRVARIFFSPR